MKANGFPPATQLDLEGDYRFIQVTGPDNRSYVYGTGVFDCHKKMFDYFRTSLGERGIDASGFRCVGGGHISIGAESIRVYDKSDDFGYFSRLIVEPLLAEYVERELPGRSLEIEAEPVRDEAELSQ